MLSLRLLGTPVVERDGARLLFDTRKAVALLALLEIEAHPHSRERLASMLWPDADASRARSALRRTLSVTAAAVGDALRVDRSAVALDPAQVTSDVGEFSRLVGSDRLTDLTRATELYRDDFLAGFTLRDSEGFDEWQTFVAEGLRQQLAGCLERLVELTAASGDFGCALTHARRWSALDPLHEPAHQWLLRLYAWSGQRAAALRQYRTCVRVLDRELGVAPLQETTALYDAVRADRLAPPAPEPTDVRPVAPAPPTPPRAAQRLVGRDDELRRLADAVGETPNRSRVLVVSGAPGTGKTALLGAVRTQVDDAGGRTLAVRCHQEESALAFGVVVELLRAACTADPDLAAHLPEHVRREVGRLLPELGGASEPEPLEGPGALARLYAAVSQTLALARGDAAVVAVVVDDAHWADAASAGLLAYVVRRLPEARILFAFGWLAAAMPAGSALAAAVGEAVAEGVGTALEVGGLSRDAVADLLQDLSGDAVDDVYAATGGVPLLVSAYAAGGVEGSSAPATVRAALAGRLQALTETAQQTLAAAAVLGGRVDPASLRATSGRSETETVEAVEELLRHGLLVEAAGSGAYDLPFDALRRVALETTTLARRRLLHGRAADALVRSLRRGDMTPAAAGRVAMHLHEAGRDDDAAQWHWRATLAARGLYAHDEALTHVREALALGHRATEAHLAEGEILTALGRYREALAAYESAAAGHEPDSPELAAVEHRLADVHHRLGEYAAADAHLEAALSLVPDDAEHAAVRARVLADRALVGYRRGDQPAAQAYVDVALASARQADDATAIAQALDVLGVLEARRGDTASGEAHLKESLEHARRVGDAAAAVAALNNLSRLAAEAGDTDAALAWAEEALALGRVHGDRHRVAALHTNLADLLHASGRTSEAMDHLKDAASLFAGVDDDTQRRPEIWKLVEW